MIGRQDLLVYLDNYLTTPQFVDYCPNGLQVEGKERIQTLAVAVSASLVTIEQAIVARADALLVHHGIFWEKEPRSVVGVLKKKLRLLLENGISLFAYHLPLDAHQEVGNNWKAASDLGWNNLAPFGLFNGKSIGVRGEFEKMPVEIFVAEVEAYYGHHATVALGGKKTVQSAALVSGGAYRSIKEAARCGVDCFITGNFDEPAFADAHEEGVNFLALGHTATEKVGVKALGAHLEKMHSIACPFLDVYNPF